MVEDWIPGHAEAFQSRRRRPSFSSALLEAISRSTDTNTCRKSLEMRRTSRDSTKKPQQEKKFFSESPTLLYSSSEAEMRRSGRPFRRSADDFRFSQRLVVKQDSPLFQPRPSSKKEMKGKPMSPGSKLASFFNSLFSLSSSKKKSQQAKDDHVKEKATTPGSLSHSSSVRSRGASTPSSNKVSDVYKRYDSSVEASSYTKPNPFSANNPSSAVKHNNNVKMYSHRSVTFCPTNVILDENFNRREKQNISGDKYDNKPYSLLNQHGNYNFHNSKVLYEEEEEEEEEEEVASDSSSDLFELENLNAMDMDVGVDIFSTDLPVFGTTHLETNRAIAKGLR